MSKQIKEAAEQIWYAVAIGVPYYFLIHYHVYPFKKLNVFWLIFICTTTVFLTDYFIKKHEVWLMKRNIKRIDKMIEEIENQKGEEKK